MKILWLTPPIIISAVIAWLSSLPAGSPSSTKYIQGVTTTKATNIVTSPPKPRLSTNETLAQHARITADFERVIKEVGKKWGKKISSEE